MAAKMAAVDLVNLIFGYNFTSRTVRDTILMSTHRFQGTSNPMVPLKTPIIVRHLGIQDGHHFRTIFRNCSQNVRVNFTVGGKSFPEQNENNCALFSR